MENTPTVSEQWAAYRKKCEKIAPHAPAVFYDLLRAAFFSGFRGCFDVMGKGLSKLTQEEAMVRLRRYDRELESFMDSMLEGLEQVS